MRSIRAIFQRLHQRKKFGSGIVWVSVLLSVFVFVFPVFPKYFPFFVFFSKFLAVLGKILVIVGNFLGGFSLVFSIKKEPLK